MIKVARLFVLILQALIYSASSLSCSCFCLALLLADEDCCEGSGIPHTLPAKWAAESIEEQAAQIVAKATGNADLAPKLNKRATPEDAEDHEIEEETTTLMDLCDDKHKWGKTSEIEKQMQASRGKSSRLVGCCW